MAAHDGTVFFDASEHYNGGLPKTIKRYGEQLDLDIGVETLDAQVYLALTQKPRERPEPGGSG